MRRFRLPPPRPIRVAGHLGLDPALGMRGEPISDAHAHPAASGAPRSALSGPGDLAHGKLAGPRPARPRLRRLFNPVTGWFRRLERRANLWLSRAVYPRLPVAQLAYAWQLDRHLTVAEADIELADLPAGFEGMTVLLITDIHTGPFLAPAPLSRAFERLLALQPDLIVLGGDLTTGRVNEFEPFAPVFARLAEQSPVYAVLGNHDHYSGDPAGLRASVEATGIRVLDNACVTLRRNGAALRLAGIDDLHWGKPDLEAALAGPAAAVTILLSHNPDIFFEARRRGVALVLAGHTHGGQIRVPALPVLVRMSRYRLDEGHYVAGDAQLVVSRGLGATGLPVRLFCPPEAVLLRLGAAGRRQA